MPSQFGKRRRERRPVRVALACLVWALLAPAALLAQERRELALGDAQTPVTVLADRIENLERDRLLIAEGRVEIEQGEVRIEADRAEVNTETGEAVASGQVVLFDGRDRLHGERLEYNFRAGTGVLHQGEGVAAPHFFFGGKRMERFGDKAYRLRSGVFTTCEDETPDWSVRWRSATAYLDDYVWGTGASFWVWKIPVVPFLPVFAASLRRDRGSGLLTPTFGSSSEKGFWFRQPIYWAISDSQDLLLAPTYFENRGLGVAGAYRYVRREESRGELSGFYLRDTHRHDDRGVFAFRHEEQLTPRLSLKADLARVSDITFFPEFGDTADERGRQRLESNLSLTQRWDKWNFVGRLFTYQDLTTTEAIELHRLPELRLNAFQQSVPWAEGLLYEFETSYNNFVRDIGSAGQRFDLRPQLSYPVTPAGLFTVTPRLGFRETAYDTRVTGFGVDRGFFVETTEKELTTRTLFEGGLDLEARAYRVFNLDGALGIQRLQHAIEPRAEYRYLRGDDPTELPQWDGIDAIRPDHTVTYSLTNRVKARAVSGDDQPGRVWELFRLTFSQTYYVEPAPPRTTSSLGLKAPVTPVVPGVPAAPIQPVTFLAQKRFADVFADLIFEPVYGFRLRATAAFNPYEEQVISATTDFSYDARDWRLSFGTRHGLDGELQFVQGSTQVKLGSRWTFRFSSDYDTVTDSVIENRFEAMFREQCWAITAAYINRRSEDEFRISVNLLELGQYGFGRAFATTQ